MLILSKFRDYYDSSAAYGVDKSIVYRRVNRNFHKERILEIEHIMNKWRTWYGGGMSLIVIGGIPYPLFKHWDHLRNVHYVYDDDTLVEVLKNDKRDTHSWAMGSKLDDYRAFKENIHQTTSETFHALNRRYNAPIIHIRLELDGYKTDQRDRLHVEVNPCLKDIGFSKALDSIQLFQNIQNYISTCDVKDLVELKDEDKVIKSGFDKRSFRKRKT